MSYVKEEARAREQAFLDAIDQLVAARIREANAFIHMKLRAPKITDGQATRMAYVETKGEVDRLEAEVAIARRNMEQ